MLETTVVSATVSSVVKEFYKRMRPSGWKNRAASSIIIELHEKFEEVHYNYIEIFRELLWSIPEKGLDSKFTREEAIETFLEKRSLLEIERHELRGNIGSILAGDWPDLLKEYLWVISMYFLNEEDHGWNPTAINVFFNQAKIFNGPGTVGDRYFDTPSMRLAREIANLTDEVKLSQTINRAINGLSLKKQPVQAIYFKAKYLAAA